MIDEHKTLSQVDAETNVWMAAAACGEAPWVCADCGASFPGGMPDACVYGHESCTRILLRDKQRAMKGKGT